MNLTAKEIAGMLAARAEDVCRVLLPGGKKNGGEWEAGSTAGDKGKSLKVRLSGPKAGVWCDFSNGEEKGDLLTLWAQAKNVELANAIQEAKKWLGVFDIGSIPQKKTYAKPIPKPAQKLTGTVLKYLTEDRGLDLATLDQFKVGVGTDGQTITLPFFSPKGELQNIKQLWLKRDEARKKTFKTVKDCAPALFGWQALKGGRTIAITEGEIDAMTMHQYGVPSLSIPFGAGTGGKLNWIDFERENLARFETIYLCYDNDEEGQACVGEVAMRLGRERCLIVTLPFKDANECLQNGVEAFEIQRCFDEATHADPLIEARSICDFQRRLENNPDELLRNGFLCWGGSLLIPAPTGIGKSVFVIQCACLWAVGKSAFGIEPARPLRCLIIQAENDDGDVADMRDGIIEGLGLMAEQVKEIAKRVLIHRECVHTGMSFCLEVLKPLLETYKPDLVFLDPLFSFVGCDVSNQEKMSQFLRNWLNPLLIEHRCAAVVVHHTNKPPSGKEKPNWSAGDFAYLGSGSIELANWARAILAIRSIGSHDVFSLYAGKRGKRLRWTNADGSPTMQRLIGHSNKSGVMFWRDVDESEIQAPEVTADHVLSFVPASGRIERGELQDRAQAGGLGRDKARRLINELLDAGRLFESKEKRPGKRDRIFISRYQA